MQMTNYDIEDLCATAAEVEGCPYYGARRAIPYLQLVLLPYNSLLSRSNREALGIDLRVRLSRGMNCRIRLSFLTRRTT